MQKNKNAVALGKLKRGTREKFSKDKLEAVRKNLEKARAKRWVKNKLK